MDATDSSVRGQIVELLGYPIELARDQIELDECAHAGFYDGDDGHCRACTVELECEWLMGTGERGPLGRRSIEDLLAALEFALCYVDAYLARRAHRRLRCTCRACRWLAEARALAERLGAGEGRPG